MAATRESIHEDPDGSTVHTIVEDTFESNNS